MSRRAYPAALIASLLVAVAAPAVAEATSRTVRLHLGPTPTTWRSPEREPQSIPFEIRSVKVDGRSLIYAETPSPCLARMYGHGATVEFNTCGERARLRIRATALRHAKLVVRYVAPR